MTVFIGPVWPPGAGAVKKNTLRGLGAFYVDAARDRTPPAISVSSPAEYAGYSRTIVIEGTVSDRAEDGEPGKVASLSCEIVSHTAAKAASFDSSGAYTIEEPNDLKENIVVLLKAVDWNGNETELRLPLTYPGNEIPSFAAVEGNRQAALSWEEVPGVERYRLYVETSARTPDPDESAYIDAVGSPYVVKQLKNVELSFFQSGYMDAPTPVAAFPAIQARASVDFGLIAAFNQEVFRIEGTVPVAGELIVKYRAKGRSAEQRFPLSYQLMDKTAIVWDDDRKVGAFVTPSDSALRNFGSYVRRSLKNETLPQLNDALQTAAQLYAALGRLGLIYQADPSSPFVKAQAGKELVDSVSLGRDTLARGSGDCDDLTVLFASLLEALGVETGYITVPGHIYPAFNTRLPARSYRELHPDRNRTIVVDGDLWVPVEITMVGRQGFVDAWGRAVELWKLYDGDAERRAFTKTAAAQERYRPVGLRESDLGLQYGAEEPLREAYRAEFGSVADSALAEMAAAAKKAFDRAAAIDPERVRDFAYLAQVGAGQAGAARAAESKEAVLFLDDE